MKRLLLVLLVVAAFAVPAILLLGGLDRAPEKERQSGRSAISVSPTEAGTARDAGPGEDRPAELAVATGRGSSEPSATNEPSPTRVAQSIDSQWVAAPQFLTGTLMGPVGAVDGADVELVDDKGKILANGLSAGGGRFHLPTQDSVQGAWLHVDAAGFAPLVAGPYSISDQPARTGVLRLVQGIEQSGTVLGPSGQPVAGAEVRLHRGGRIQHPNRPLLAVRTNAQGRFKFERAPRGAALFEARARGFGTRQAGPVTLPRSSGVEIALSVAHTMIVRVQDPNGRAIPNATLTFSHSRRQAPDRTAQTDAEGAVRLDDLGAPTWEVRASAPSYRPERMQAAQANGSTTVVILEPWPCVSGIVIGESGSPPPPGTQVVAIPSSASGVHQPRRDLERHPVNADGSFRICDLRPGHYVVRVESSSFAPTASPPLRVEYDRDPRPIRINLKTGGGFDLRVQDLNGPIAGASIEIHDREPPERDLWTSPSSPSTSRGTTPAQVLTTDAKGEAKAENLAAGSTWLLVRADKHVPLLRGPLTTRSGRMNRVPPLTLQPAAFIRGSVTSSDAGRFVVGARLTLQASGRNDQRIHLISDRRGEFVSPPLPPGTYEVNARRGSSRSGRGRVQEQITLKPGGDVTIELELD